jgi:hypothetical protein
LREYEGNDNYGNPKQDYVDKIAKMTNRELYEETRSKIWLSAYANSNPKSDYHWHINALYDEWVDNRKNPEGYEKAYQAEYRANFG